MTTTTQGTDGIGIIANGHIFFVPKLNNNEIAQLCEYTKNH